VDSLFIPRAIGFARTPFTDTAQVPKGPGTKHEANGVIEILPEFAAGLTHIEGFSHLFVLWVFDRSDGFELLGAPPGEEVAHGVFATRSPFRPNPIALTVVELLRRDGSSLHVHGVDMLDGTPILDIKPYMSSISAESLRRGWLEEAEKRRAKRKNR
jgi:tRNA-Thr(GGU) m(6)t(6)A37 methyltransferase TsaA